MAQVTDDGFIVIDNQVAMPEETLCKLLNVTPQRISELVRFAGMKYERGGVYFRDGKYYFASPEVVFKMNALNDAFSERLSERQVHELFEAAEKRLLSHKWLALAQRETSLVVLFVIGITFFGLSGLIALSSSSKSTNPPTKTEQTAKQLKEKFYSVSYNTLEKVTGLRVTEKYGLSVREDSDEEITTYGYVEFENDRIKHPFWITFKKSTKKVLRVDIDTSVVYVADDW